MAFHCQRVEQSYSGKEGVISGGKNAGEDDGVDDTPRCFCASHFKHNGERGGGCLLLRKAVVVVWDVETDQKDGEDTAVTMLVKLYSVS